MAYNAETLSFDLPDTDMIYVEGLPEGVSIDEVAEHFGSIGVVKFDKKKNQKKVWLYKDKATGKPKGDGTVTYEDPFSAASAVSWFNGKEFKGSTIKVTLAEKKEEDYSRGGRGSYGGGGGGRGGRGGRGGGGYGGGGG
eukprot:CAMPEP_0206142158 /NCGR_PEP_ID=MMETSP1473-20131121/15841_1 /ASSEMBLY_ACC=CAM_ASM_001109 /TAXON_ID=1461547 /ORGANISM="Stichococcus sp, Strain RCC1054" /LENGTH=138 /DNA_ID=CAMNT_0053537043 /DNA_START=244 /DNA_END=657 /DNA_ORIENTATION=-